RVGDGDAVLGIADLAKPGELDLDSHDEATLLCDCHAEIRRSRAGCPDPVLPYVCDHRGAVVLRRTAAHCARTAATRGNRAALASQDLVVALDLDAAGQSPACGGTDELVVVP